MSRLPPGPGGAPAGTLGQRAACRTAPPGLPQEDGTCLPANEPALPCMPPTSVAEGAAAQQRAGGQSWAGPGGGSALIRRRASPLRYVQQPPPTNSKAAPSSLGPRVQEPTAPEACSRVSLYVTAIKLVWNSLRSPVGTAGPWGWSEILGCRPLCEPLGPPSGPVLRFPKSRGNGAQGPRRRPP